jgi:hypothetical protein
MAAELCVACRQPIRHRRYGVLLPPYKCRLLDMVKAAGSLGISTQEIVDRLGADPTPDAFKRKKLTIKANIWQLNAALAGSGYEIAVQSYGPGARWVVRRKGGGA